VSPEKKPYEDFPVLKVLATEEKTLKKRRERIDMLSTPKKNIHSSFSHLTPLCQSALKFGE
jgi:hypothetical protein